MDKCPLAIKETCDNYYEGYCAKYSWESVEELEKKFNYKCDV